MIYTLMCFLFACEILMLAMVQVRIILGLRDIFCTKACSLVHGQATLL